MWYYQVAPTKIVRSKTGVFTYSSDIQQQPGQVVHIEAGSKVLLGLIMSEVSQPEFSTKPIIDAITDTPIPSELLRLSEWLAEYYHTPLATVLQTLLPRGIDKKRRVRKEKDSLISVRERTQIVLNSQQQAAVTSIMNAPQATTILQGITGSGKTEVYKEIARQTIANGKSVIVLVPEISLTSQLVAEFSHDFDDMILTHSHMTEAERHHAWNAALTATKPHIIIGPRSALFLPIQNVGAILIDEAHEPSYKQEQSPRYSAVRAASVLGKLYNAPVVLGSATPLVADRYIAESGGHPIIRLDTSARRNTIASKVTVIDMKQREQFKKHRFISDTLISHIDQNITNNTQSLIFHNRRGSAATTLCENCGWTAQCPRCYIPLTLHADQFRISCHICGHNERVPTHCPVCQSADIIHKGIGTKLIESELRRLFPKARIARFDADSKSDETVDQLYDALYKGEIDIAIGTQIVAKGLDLPKLRTVGVIQADGGLSLPDFASSERTFQLLAQVVGRVGRNEHASDVIIQTYQPTHPVVTLGVSQNYDEFYTYTLEQRRLGHFPPFTHLLKLTDVYTSEKAAVRAAQELARTLKSNLHEDVRLLGPTPAFYERQHDTYRWQLTLKSPRREHLLEALQHVPTTHWQFELDPISLL